MPARRLGRRSDFNLRIGKQMASVICEEPIQACDFGQGGKFPKAVLVINATATPDGEGYDLELGTWSDGCCPSD